MKEIERVKKYTNWQNVKQESLSKYKRNSSKKLKSMIYGKTSWVLK